MDFPNQQPPQPQPTPTPISGGAPAGPTPPAPIPSLGSQPPATPQIPPEPLNNNTPPRPVMNGGQTIPVMSGSNPNTPPGGEIYTMPEKFLRSQNETTTPSGRPKKSRKGLTIALIVVIVLAVAGIVGGVAYYMLQGVEQTSSLEVVNDAVPADDNTNDTQENVNKNSNKNTKNQNSNKNDNKNTTANDNANANQNANTNVANSNTNSSNTNTNSNENTNSVISATKNSKDTDKDELTNEEEKLYGTKADLPDTDGDGYADGIEIKAGYDPQNGVSSTRLANNTTLATKYTDSKVKYTILYPASWITETLPESGSSEVLFTPSTLDTAGQFVSVVVEDNSTGLTAMDWYLDQVEAQESDIEEIENFDGVKGVKSLDGQTVYYANHNYIYSISYRFGNSAELHFSTTFEMMAKSFTIPNQDAAQDTTINNNGNTNN